MTIKFLCPTCQRQLRVNDEYAGKKAKCPQCGTSVLIPPAPVAPQENSSGTKAAEQVGSVSKANTKSADDVYDWEREEAANENQPLRKLPSSAKGSRKKTLKSKREEPETQGFFSPLRVALLLLCASGCVALLVFFVPWSPGEGNFKLDAMQPAPAGDGGKLNAGKLDGGKLPEKVPPAQPELAAANPQPKKEAEQPAADEPLAKPQDGPKMTLVHLQKRYDQLSKNMQPYDIAKTVTARMTPKQLRDFSSEILTEAKASTGFGSTCFAILLLSAPNVDPAAITIICDSLTKNYSGAGTEDRRIAALVRIGEPVVPHVTALFQQREYHIVAIQILIALGPQAASSLPAIIELLQTPDGSNLAATGTLHLLANAIGSAAIPPLVDQLTNATTEQRGWILQFLTILPEQIESPEMKEKYLAAMATAIDDVDLKISDFAATALRRRAAAGRVSDSSLLKFLQSHLESVQFQSSDINLQLNCIWVAAEISQRGGIKPPPTRELIEMRQYALKRETELRHQADLLMNGIVVGNPEETQRMLQQGKALLPSADEFRDAAQKIGKSLPPLPN